MEVYLDNSATTKPYDEVVKTVADVMTNLYGNPSSLHRLGKSAEGIKQRTGNGCKNAFVQRKGAFFHKRRHRE